METTSKLCKPIGKHFISSLLCLALLLVSGCGSSEHPSALVGKWKLTSHWRPLSYDVQLLKEGTAIMGGNHTTWKVKDGLVFEYKISGSTLTLNDIGTDRIATYERESASVASKSTVAP